MKNITHICLLSQAAKSVKLPTKKLGDFMESMDCSDMSLCEKPSYLNALDKEILATIKRGDLDDDGPETIAEAKLMGQGCRNITAWMKGNGFTHFIADIPPYKDVDRKMVR